jgi:hypothetical protein
VIPRVFPQAFWRAWGLSGSPEADQGALILSQCARDIGLSFIEAPDSEISSACNESLKPDQVLPRG